VTVLSDAGIDNVLAPALAPTEQVIDTEHLARMTLGDRNLEREVLALFDQQVELMTPRLDTADRSAAIASAHTLKGSAQGIGAHQVTHAATALERAARDGRDMRDEIAALASAMTRARAAIAELLRAN
jgi:HPt (histidine-containing phosphotransfer) domain-containing protein